MVTCLGPWIGMINEDAVQLLFTDLFGQYKLGWQLSNASAFDKACIFQAANGLGDTGQVDFNTHQCPVGMTFSQMYQKVAIAEADLHNDGGVSRNLGVIECHLIGQADDGEPLGEASLLAGSDKAIFATVGTHLMLAELFSKLRC